MTAPKRYSEATSLSQQDRIDLRILADALGRCAVDLPEEDRAPLARDQPSVRITIDLTVKQRDRLVDVLMRAGYLSASDTRGLLARLARHYMQGSGDSPAEAARVVLVLMGEPDNYSTRDTHHLLYPGVRFPKPTPANIRALASELARKPRRGR